MVKKSKETIIEDIEKCDIIKETILFYINIFFLSVIYSVIKKSKDFILYK